MNAEQTTKEALTETKPVLAEDLSPKYRKIPIIITKWNDGVKGWRAELPDNYQNYKPARYRQINFEDLNYHFNHRMPVHEGDSLIFSTRKDAVEAAKYCNTRYLGGKAKIWFIN